MAVSDSSAGVYAENGLNVEEIDNFKSQGNSLKNFNSGKIISNEELLALPVDILILSALENQIRADNVENIQAPYIVELANGPITPDADEVLFQKGKVIFPDVLANAGGVTVSCYEWQQNLANEKWTAEQVAEKLEKQMKKAYQEVQSIAMSRHTDLRTGAYILAIQRISEALQNQ
ncbi:MAG TPA: hypothetical protein PLQ36_01045 [Candidatus Gracilibacteria bacterium]|nr:hypothetical protein [Candidatus Gracilibacteria bacterium]